MCSHFEINRFSWGCSLGRIRAPSTEKTECLIRSVSDNIIFVTSRECIQPSKHICVGLGIKRFTGSWKIIETLNRFGHCLNYYAGEKIEIGLAVGIIEKDQVTTDGLHEMEGMCIDLAWDNYDETNETLSRMLGQAIWQSWYMLPEHCRRRWCTEW